MNHYSSRVFIALWSAALILTGLGTCYGAFRSDDVVFSGNCLSSLPLILGFLVLVAPNSVRVLQISAILYIIGFVAEMPVNPNHRWILFYVAVTIVLRVRSFAGVDAVANELQGTLRWITVIVYLFAALAKLNTAYFDPSISCGSIFGAQALELHGFAERTSTRLSSNTAIVSWIVELLLPFLLIWRRSRVFGVFLGVLFHIGLSLNFVRSFANFSTTMFLLLASWLPEDSSKIALGTFATRRRPAVWAWGSAVVFIAALSCCGLISPLEHVVARYVLYLFLALPLLMITGFLAWRCSIKHRCDHQERGVGRASWGVVILVLISAVSPYLGIKTRSGLTMYSNLRIEPNFSNHLFMPTSLDLFGYLSDTVTVTRTSDPALTQKMHDGQLQITYLTFCSYLACQDDLCNRYNRSSEIAYQRNSKEIVQALDTPLPNDCPPWIARKLLMFAPLGPKSERLCLW